MRIGNRSILSLAIVIPAGAMLLAADSARPHESKSASAIDLVLNKHAARHRPKSATIVLTADAAFSRIAQDFDVKIDVNWKALQRRKVEPDREVYLTLSDASLGQTLQGVLDYQLGRYSGFDVKGNQIIISSCDELPQIARVYSVEKFTPAERAEIVDVITTLFDDGSWHHAGFKRSGPNLIDLTGGELMVLHTAVMHRQISGFLEALGHATGERATSSFVRGTLDRKQFLTVSLCAYDVHDLVGRIEFTTPAITGPKNVVRRAPEKCYGRDGVEWMVHWTVNTRSWFAACGWPGRMGWVGDRMVVLQTPANQEDVRKLLRDVRSGKPVKGVRFLRQRKVGGSG